MSLSPYACRRKLSRAQFQADELQSFGEHRGGGQSIFMSLTHTKSSEETHIRHVTQRACPNAI
jgi:hypothetical protein